MEFQRELEELEEHRDRNRSLVGFYEKRRPVWEALFQAIWKECFLQFGSRWARENGAHVLAVKAAGDPWVYDPWPEGAQRAVRQFVGKKITNVLDTTRNAVARVVGKGLEEGHSIEQVAANIRKLYDGFGLRRSFVIARTEVIGASNYATRYAAKASEAFNVKEWISTRDDRTREAHRAMDGELQLLDEPYSNGLMFPGDPSGAAAQVIHCFPGETEVLSGPVQRAYKRWWSGDLVEITTTAGHVLAGTPNHPVLTPRGWVPLCQLNEGDHVFAYLGEQNMPAAHPNVNYVPSTMEQVFQTLSDSGMPERVLGLNVDFHGDGSSGEIQVIRTDSLLQDERETSFLQPPLQEGFPRPNFRPRNFPGDSPGVQTFRGVGCSTAGDVCSLGEFLSSDGAHPRHADFVGLASAPPLDPHSLQARLDCAAIHPVAFGEREFGFTCQVTAFEIVQIVVRPFSGHVFNLQTLQGFYTANKILSQNCRCVEVYSFDIEKEPKKPEPEPEPEPPQLSPEDELMAALADALKDEPTIDYPDPTPEPAFDFEVEDISIEELLHQQLSDTPAIDPALLATPLQPTQVLSDEAIAFLDAPDPPFEVEPGVMSEQAVRLLEQALATGNHTWSADSPPAYADKIPVLKLNNTAFAAYTEQSQWEKFWQWDKEPTAEFSGQKWVLENPKSKMIDPVLPSGKVSSGVIMLEEDGRLWVVEPKNHFGGYEHTFPKGGMKAGLDAQQTAIVETWEESGLVPSITSWLGDYKKSTSTSRYYLGVREDGAPWAHGNESQAVKLVTFEEAEKLLNKDIDKAILKDVQAKVAAAKLMVPTNEEVKGALNYDTWSPENLGLHERLKILAYREKVALVKAGLEYSQGHIANAVQILEAQGLDANTLTATIQALVPHPAPAPAPKPTTPPTAYPHLVDPDEDFLGALINNPPIPADIDLSTPLSTSKVLNDPSVQALKDLNEKIEKAIEKDLASRLTLDQFRKVGPQKGSNPGGLYEHVDTGEQWYIKFPSTDEHAYNEKAANDLYRLAGVNTPDVLLLHDEAQGKIGVASKIVQGLKSDPDKLQKPAGKGAKTLEKSIVDGFAADAWLGNWDVVGLGYDNLLIHEKTNEAWRIDAGGALLFRAQGGEKGSAWNDAATEWDTLRNKPTGTSKTVFGRYKEERFKPGLELVAAITDDQIIEAVYAAGFRDERAQALIDTLRARRETLAVRMGLKKRASLLAPTGNYGTIYGGFKTLQEAIDKAKALGGRGDQAQRARRKELEGYVGYDPARKLANVWSRWQGSSAATEDAFEEWRRLVGGQAPKDAELSRGIAAAYEILQLSLQQTEAQPELMRGVSSRTLFKELVAANVLGLSYLESSVRTWQSWTTSKREANKFMNNAREPDAGFLITKKVPKEQIVGGVCLSAGFNENGIFWDEQEFVVAADDPIAGYSRFHMSEIKQRAWGPGTPYRDFDAWRAAKERTPEGKKYIEDAVREFEENQRKRWGVVPKPGQAPPGPPMKSKARKPTRPPEGIWEDADTLHVQEKLQDMLQANLAERKKLLAQGVLGLGGPADDVEDWREINRRADGVLPPAR